MDQRQGRRMYVTPRNYPLPRGGEDNFFEKSI